MWIRQHGGRDRAFRVRLPAGYTGEAVPLVVALHGGGGWGEQIQINAAFDPIGDREGFALVYPDGIPKDVASEAIWRFFADHPRSQP